MKDQQARLDIAELKTGIATVRRNHKDLKESVKKAYDLLDGINDRVGALEGELPDPEPEPEPEPDSPTGFDIREPPFLIDIDEHQEGLDMERVVEEGFKGVVVGITEGPYPDGTSYIDHYYKAHLANAERAGVEVVGVYHYLVNAPVDAQVRLFLSLAGNLKNKLVMVDVERYFNYEYLNPSFKQVKEFIRLMRKYCGEIPLFIYSGTGYWKDILGDPSLSTNDLFWLNVYTWDASYYLDAPGSPRAGYAWSLYNEILESGIDPWDFRWGDREPQMVQFSGTGQVAGMRLDVNAFHGTVENLKSLTVPHDTALPPSDKEGSVEGLIAYGEGLIGAPYGVWPGGTIPDENPSWAQNGPPPPAPYVRARDAFCIGPPNLLRRFTGGEIPYRASILPEFRDLYDGGTWAWEEYFEDVREVFALTQPDGSSWRPLDFFGRSYGGTNLASQGHGALMWFNAHLLQSYMSDVNTGWPGVNKGVTLADSHNGWYYQYVVRREHIFPEALIKKLEERERATGRLFLGEGEALEPLESDIDLLGSFRLYQEWTEKPQWGWE